VNLRNPKIGFALVLGIFSFFLLFAVGEGVQDAAKRSGSGFFWPNVLLILVLGSYFLSAAYFLSRGDPRPEWQHGPTILALNGALIITAIVALVSEPNRDAALFTAACALLAMAFSLAGAALAARAARRSGGSSP
jgi:hypothetical protein